MPENALFIERDAARGGEVGGDPRAQRNLVVEGDQSGMTAPDALHGPGKGGAEGFENLEHREIRIGETPLDEEALAGGVAREHAFEIAEVFGHAMPEEDLRAL